MSRDTPRQHKPASGLPANPRRAKNQFHPVVREGLATLGGAVSAVGRSLPRHVQKELEGFLGCGAPKTGRTGSVTATQRFGSDDRLSFRHIVPHTEDIERLVVQRRPGRDPTGLAPRAGGPRRRGRRRRPHGTRGGFGSERSKQEVSGSR